MIQKYVFTESVGGMILADTEVAFNWLNKTLWNVYTKSVNIVFIMMAHVFCKVPFVMECFKVVAEGTFIPRIFQQMLPCHVLL